ncbi:MAG: aldehyde dehydrogenase [Psychrosphaera sp.]|nr:aldehyde dehydrogenase [Psychrosphaera sp.]
MEKIANYIDGALVAPQSNEYLDNVAPAIGQVYSLIPDSTEQDVEASVAAAEKAFTLWSGLTVDERSAHLERLARAIEDNADELALAESVDNGKPLSLAKTVDIPRGSANIRFFSHAITQYASESHSMGDIAVNFTLREPIGIVGCISPRNLPLYLFTWKIAPALAAGNCVVAKPSEVTPMTAYLLSKICEKIGFPKGVLNILHGLGHKVGNAIVSHPKVKAISFTGGTATGAHIASIAAPKFKKLSLELGGKNPALIFADCDFEETLNTVVRASFANQGQICLCSSRIYIERAIYDKFRDAYIEKVKQLKVGDPLEEGTAQGAVVSEAHMNKVLGYIDLAKQEGGKCLVGGERAHLTGRCENGFFIYPTVFEGLKLSDRVNQEEVFGPVVTIQPFDSEEEAVELANGTQYGLAATVFSSDVKRCHGLARQLDFGIVWVNTWLLRDLRTPFGGAKSSGVGREGGFEALKFFTEAKNVCVKY